jgi:hypothetical protein
MIIYKQKWFGDLIPPEYLKSMLLSGINIINFGDNIEQNHDRSFTGTPREAAAAKDEWVIGQLIAGDVVVFDCDLVPLKPFPFDKPGAYTIYEYGRPSPGMMASIRDAGRQWWSNRNKNRIERGIQWPYGVFNKLFRPEWLYEDDIPFAIPPEYYIHHRLMTGGR